MVIKHYSLSNTINNINACTRFDDIHVIISNICPKYSTIRRKCLRYFYYKTLFLRFVIGRDLIIKDNVKNELISIIYREYKKSEHYYNFLTAMEKSFAILQKHKYSFSEIKDSLFTVFESPFLTADHYRIINPLTHYEKLTNKQKKMLEETYTRIYNNFVAIKLKYYKEN